MPDATGVTGADVLDTLIAWGTMYRECQIRHNGLVEALSK